MITNKFLDLKDFRSKRFQKDQETGRYCSRKGWSFPCRTIKRSYSISCFVSELHHYQLNHHFRQAIDCPEVSILVLRYICIHNQINSIGVYGYNLLEAPD